ncbi:MAG: hypothetical protein WCG78_08150, partial [Candidatus Omnitrophota bacterium]
AIILMLALSLLVGVTSADAGKVRVLKKTSTSSSLDFLRHQIRPSGFIDSYVEDTVEYSYTYDDAMAAMAFISSGDYVSARKILDAFLQKGPLSEGGFSNLYNSTTGVSLGILAVGHNAYLVQAINRYYRQTHDARYNALARTVADYILTQQALDGGIYGRAGVTWKSTENNLAAFTAIWSLGSAQNLISYGQKAMLIHDFLLNKCWDGTRFLTGENDTMIVTDTQALGGMILGQSFKNGAYWVRDYTGTTKTYQGKSVTGYDENTDRDTVWTEGTLQEAMAFLVAGDTTAYLACKAEAEKLLNASTGAFMWATNRGTTGFGDYFESWQAVAPTAWYIIVANQDDVFWPF